MNIWCCAALVLGGGEPPLPVLPLPPSSEPPLEARPLHAPLVRTEAPCNDCGGKVLPRPPISHRAIPSMTPPDQAQLLTSVSQSPGSAVERPRSMMTAAPRRYETPAVYQRAEQYPSAPPQTQNV